MRGVWDGEAESRLVAADIERWVRGRRYADIAILVRASFQMRAFEERFVLLQIPYSVVGGPRFFERAEIRDAHAYLRLVQSGDDDLAFERIVNTPRRGIGEATVRKLLQIGRDRAVSASVAANDLVHTDELVGRSRTALAGFLRDVERWRGQKDAVAHPRLAETILEESGYIDALRLDMSPTSQSRLENLKELVQSMGAFDSLEAYLEHVALVSDLDREAGGDSVQIMTLHSAKETWNFPTGLPCQAGKRACFPASAASMRTARRAWRKSGGWPTSVSLAPAKKLAFPSPPTAKSTGRWTSQLPSRFVDELPLANVEAASETGYYGGGLRDGASRWDEAGYGHEAASARPVPAWRRCPGAAGVRRRTAQPYPGHRRRRSPGRRLRRGWDKRVRDRRAGLPPEVRAGRGDRRGGQQAHCRL